VTFSGTTKMNRFCLTIGNRHCRTLRFHMVLLTFLIVTMALTGCATGGQIKTAGGAAAELLPRPGATVEVGEITSGAEKHPDLDPVVLFRESLITALREENILWSGDKATPRFLFDAKIMNYEPGNAFRRWVLPGWGSTILEVHGELRTSDRSTVAAIIDNKRSVAAGGAYTIGAWKSIFSHAASDLAQEMKARINGGGFVVALHPYSEQQASPVQTRTNIGINIINIIDLRSDKLRLGERTAALGVKMGDIYPNRRVAEYLTETLSDALRAAGHKVGSSGNGLDVEGEILKFRVETPATVLYWDVTAEVEFRLRVKKRGKASDRDRIFISRKSERTYAWPSASLIETAVSASVADLMRQIQSDDIWGAMGPGTATR
jgi:hypothetical protein